MELIVLIGIPGSGKSRYVKEKGYENSHMIICPDIIRQDIFGDMTDQSNNIRVWDMVRGMLMAGVSVSKDMLLDATNVNAHYLRETIRPVSENCVLTAFMFNVDPDVASERIADDIFKKKDRSKVPESVVYRMYGEYLYTKKLILEGNIRFSQAFIIDSNTEDIHEFECVIGEECQ